MKKVITVILSLLLTITIGTEAFASTITGVRLINNTSSESDYKLSPEESKTVVNSVKPSSDIIESFSNDGGYESVDNKTIDYLIQNNIISREQKISVTRDGITLEKGEIPSNISKTDFLMYLYKTVNGVVPSRPFVIKVNSKRLVDGKVKELNGASDYVPNNGNPEDTYEFNEGDYEVFISPNVQELYLSKLLSTDIIDRSEIQDQNFLDQYDNLVTDGASEQPEWSNELQPYIYGDNPVSTNNQLGKAWKFGGIYRYFMKNPKKFVINRVPVSFFVSEQLTKMEAYRYINKMINPNGEKVTINPEILNYKYGSDEILKLNESDRDIMFYLLSNGILDGSNVSEYANLNEQIDTNIVFNILYRLHSDNNRIANASDELTESDRYFIDNGFTKNNISVYDNDDIQEPITLSVQRVDSKFTSYHSEYIPRFGDKEDEQTSTVSSDEKADYEVVKLFPNPDLVEVEGKSVASLSTGGSVSAVENTSNGVKVTFKTKAANDTQALSIIDSKITYTNLGKTDKMLQTVTKTTSGDKSVTYVGAKELSNVDGEISVLTNKVLKNKVTGDTAIILKDAKTAMIGNKIIVSDDPMVIINKDETYYNMDVVVNLMTNSYISKLDPGKIFKDANLPIESVIPVTGVGSEIEKTTIINGMHHLLDGYQNNEQFFNINLVSRGLTSLTRDFIVDGKKVSVVIDWSYSLPGDDDKIRNLFEKVDDDFSVKDASEFLFTRPSDGDAQAWWDNNVEVSNALANVMYGTEGVPYITSGWLKPDVTLLINDSELSKSQAVKEIFGNIKFSKEFTDSKLGGKTEEFDSILFNGGEGDLTQRRSFEAMSGVEKDGCYVFENIYIVSPTGAIYKSVANDKRVKFEDNQLKVSGRANVTSEETTGKVEVKVVDESFYLEEFDAQFDKYYKLTAVNPVRGKLKEVNSRITIDDGNGNDALYNKIDEWATKFKLENNDYLKPKDYKPEQFIGNLPLQYYTPYENYLIDGNIFTHSRAMLGLERNPNFDKSSDEANAFPVLYLSRTNFIIQNGTVVRRRGNPYLEQGNVFFSGLNSTLISRLIDNQVGNITFNKLPMGSTVIIQDVKYRRTERGLESEPIDNKTLATNLMNNRNNQTEIDRAILSEFKGLQILFSGRPVSFTSYITKCDIGDLAFDTPHKTGYKGSNGYMFAENKDNKIDYTGQDVDSICIRIDLDPSVEFFQLDEQNQVYAMRNASSKYSDGYLDNISIFSEDLGFGVADDMFMELTDNQFRPLVNFRDIFKEYQLMYHSAMKGDIISILQFFFTIVLCYGILVSWICAMILKGKVGLNILLALRNPSGVKGAEGFDLVKIFSFGIWNLDTEPGTGALFIADLLMFCLLYANLNCAAIIRTMFY